MNSLFRWILYFAIVSVVLAHPFIVGGSETNVRRYPSMVALLFSRNSVSYLQGCGGTIITNRAILTAAHCIFGWHSIQWLARVGSTYANYGGVIYRTESLVIHPDYNAWTIDFDIGIVRTVTGIVFVSNTVQPATLSGTHYSLPDNEAVWAAGWGSTEYNGKPAEVLRHVQLWTINQSTCRYLYASYRKVTDNMLCAGFLGIGGRDQCTNDSGGPLFHRNVLVGVCSWGNKCGEPFYPGVNTRVSKVIHWIVQNVHVGSIANHNIA